MPQFVLFCIVFCQSFLNFFIVHLVDANARNSKQNRNDRREPASKAICQQFGIHYYTATKKERYFVEEVTRVT